MIELNTERMYGMGPCNVDDFQINYLYGLNDLCEKFLQKDFRILELGYRHRNVHPMMVLAHHYFQHLLKKLFV
jgi:hypothetical protein